MPFTPVQTFLGGYLLHLSTSSLLDDTGRVLGISGIVNGALFDDKAGWRWTIIGGLLGGPLVLRLVGLDGLILGDGVGSWEMLGQTVVRTGIAGVLIGFGSKVGLERFSPPWYLDSKLSLIFLASIPSAVYVQQRLFSSDLISAVEESVHLLCTPLTIAAWIRMYKVIPAFLFYPHIASVTVQNRLLLLISRGNPYPLLLLLSSRLL